ncbi:MAG TPA: YwqG family protein [Haloferula sp.]
MSDENFRGLIKRLSLPGLLLQASAEPTNSYLGGMPPADLAAEWPHWKGRPLAFLACIRLADTGDTLPWLPRHGRLLFFYDLEETPWGYDPADRGSWQVIHLQGDGDGGSATPPSNLPKEHRIPVKHLRFDKADLPPTWDHPSLDQVELTDSQGEWLEEHRESLRGDNDASHQMGSYASAVQNADMEMECQLASNGLYVGDSTGYKDPRAAELKEGASDWRLLLQVDSDDDINLMWGDVGMVYFWVREQDARAGDFSRTWMVLQCH